MSYGGHPAGDNARARDGSCGSRQLRRPMTSAANEFRRHLQHDRATPAQPRVLPLSTVCQAEGQVIPPLLKLGPACLQTSAPRQPTVPADCAYRQADDIGQPPPASPAGWQAAGASPPNPAGSAEQRDGKGCGQFNSSGNIAEDAVQRTGGLVAKRLRTALRRSSIELPDALPQRS
jgi:hypothetical protein